MNHFASLLMRHLHFNYDIKEDVNDLIRRSGANLDLLRGKKVLITGGTGFFGIWLISALSVIKKMLEGDLDIIVLTRSVERYRKNAEQIGINADIELIEGDVCHVKLVERNFTHLVHMATTNASETFAGEDQLNKLHMLYAGTKNVLDQCTSSLESVLFTSSGVAYGNNLSEKIAETDLSAPDTTQIGSALAIGKLAAEYLVTYYAQKLDFKYSIARCFAFSGPYLPLDLHYAFGNFVANGLSGEDIVINGDGLTKRSYLYIGDAVAWLLRMMIEPKNQLINVGSEHSLSMKKLAEHIADRAKVGVKVLGEVNEVGNFIRSNYIPNTAKARRLYSGLQEWTSVEEIIEKMLKPKRLPLKMANQNDIL
jgi:dTDP-glucose 4,6-dehydratase/UDP-glucose 4-epimerase